MPKKIYLFITFSVIFFGCTSPEKKDISFYYWKTNFTLTPYTSTLLKENKVNHLYIRYFDIIIKNNEIMPNAVIQFSTPPDSIKIIPVIYIKNEVWKLIKQNTHSKQEINIQLKELVHKTAYLVSLINRHIEKKNNQIQFDSDWDANTKDIFFAFLELWKKYEPTTEPEVTLRLHQIKYPEKMGIPPVKKGVLMFYNIGAINTGEDNSIYEKENAEKYIGYLKNYPIPLAVALPIFSWGQQIRNGKVIQLLNKFYRADCKKETNFVEINTNLFIVKKSFFKFGYYFKKNDSIKIEDISEDDLNEMLSMIEENKNHPVKEIIFYDLDSSNIVHYDKNIFQKMAN